MSIPLMIAIDGPAASGKSTLGKRLADELGYLFFDTGVMYRALTWLALQTATPVGEEAALARLLDQADIDVRPASVEDGRSADVLVNDQDVTWLIRRPEVDANVSQVSSYREVRQVMSDRQRKIGLRGRVVMVGRDIGTVVLPEADLKIYLDASVEERARRRFSEQQARGEPAEADAILQAMRRRDQIDSTRDIAPLRAAEDAIVIDSDRMDMEQVLEKVRQLLRQTA